MVRKFATMRNCRGKAFAFEEMTGTNTQEKQPISINIAGITRSMKEYWSKCQAGSNAKTVIAKIIVASFPTKNKTNVKSLLKLEITKLSILGNFGQNTAAVHFDSFVEIRHVSLGYGIKFHVTNNTKDKKPNPNAIRLRVLRGKKLWCSMDLVRHFCAGRQGETEGMHAVGFFCLPNGGNSVG